MYERYTIFNKLFDRVIGDDVNQLLWLFIYVLLIYRSWKPHSLVLFAPMFLIFKTWDSNIQKLHNFVWITSKQFLRCLIMTAREKKNFGNGLRLNRSYFVWVRVTAERLQMIRGTHTILPTQHSCYITGLIIILTHTVEVRLWISWDLVHQVRWKNWHQVTKL